MILLKALACILLCCASLFVVVTLFQALLRICGRGGWWGVPLWMAFLPVAVILFGASIFGPFALFTRIAQ